MQNGDFETGQLGLWQCTGSHCNVVQVHDGGFVANNYQISDQRTPFSIIQN